MHSNKVFFIKSIHTILFLLMSSSIVYVLYCGITRTYSWILFVAIGAVLIEGLVLFFNHFKCPLTNLAEKYGAEKGTVTDMFYPKWFVPHVFRFSTVLFVIGLILLGLTYFIK